MIAARSSGSFDPGSRPVIWIDGVAHDLNEVLLEEGLAISSVLTINRGGQIGGVVASLTDAMLLTPRSERPGDLDCDLAVRTGDLLSLLRRWGPCGLCPADLNRDRIVNDQDLKILLNNWGP